MLLKRVVDMPRALLGSYCWPCDVWLEAVVFLRSEQHFTFPKICLWEVLERQPAKPAAYDRIMSTAPCILHDDECSC